MAVLKIPAVYMRGGTSKGVFFNARDLPRDPERRDRVLLRVLGSPDPYSRQTDGMGGASPSTSRVVVVDASSRDDCDVEYRCGQVAIDRPVIDWSTRGGSLAVAVGPYAVQQGLVAAREGTTVVRIWQPHPGRWLAAHVEVRGGEVLEDGVFTEDGVPFPAAEVRLDFIDDGASSLLPTGRVQDVLDVEGMAPLPVSLVRTDADEATIFARASDLGLNGREKPDTFNRDARTLARLESVRIAGAVAMGRLSRARAEKPGVALPRLIWVAPPMSYKSAGATSLATASTCWLGAWRTGACSAASGPAARFRWRWPPPCPGRWCRRWRARCPAWRPGSAMPAACRPPGRRWSATAAAGGWSGPRYPARRAA